VHTRVRFKTLSIVPIFRFAALQDWVPNVRGSRVCFGQTTRLTRFFAIHMSGDSRIAPRARHMGLEELRPIDPSSDIAWSFVKRNQPSS
jgi:hypothetical protein